MTATRIVIRMDGLYLNRRGHSVGIVRDHGAGRTWRYLTTRGHYVLVDGRAAYVGESVEDLVRDITPTAAAVAGMDSMLGSL